MASFNYRNAQKTADRLIKQFGFKLPVLKPVYEFDPVSGLNTIVSIQVSTNNSVSLPASSGTVQAFDNKFKEDLKKGKIRFLYISSKELSFEIEAGDLVIFENRLWHIAGATPLNPAGVSVYNTVGIRDGGLELEKVLDDLGAMEQLTLIQSLDDMIVVGETSQTFRDYLYDIITKSNGNIFT
jgi:hypothetical protein